MKKLKKVDRLSGLPDEILGLILSLLVPKQAGATCILSRRWRNIWVYNWVYCMNLNFDFQYGFLESFKDLGSSARYARWVNRVLEHHTLPNIHQFRVCFYYDIEFRRQIDKWIMFAMEKKVKILQLNLCWKINPRRRYNLPKKIFGPKIIKFDSLNVLELKNVNVSDEIVEKLLFECCPVLESLVVYDSKTLIDLRVVSPPHTLKHLELQNCGNLKRVEVCDSNLVSFCVEEIAVEFVLRLKNLPNLVDVSITLSSSYGICGAFRQISDFLPQLQVLKLHIYRNRIRIGMESNNIQLLPILTNIKHLGFVIDVNDDRPLHLLNSLVKAFPCMQSILLEFPQSALWKGRIYLEAPKCPHHYLKEVKLVHYRFDSYVGFVDYFLKNAVVLEKIVVDPLDYSGRPSDPHRFNFNLKEKNSRRNQDVEQLKARIPSPIAFVCLS